jgi:hypothetical protein
MDDIINYGIVLTILVCVIIYGAALLKYGSGNIILVGTVLFLLLISPWSVDFFKNKLGVKC